MNKKALAMALELIPIISAPLAIIFIYSSVDSQVIRSLRCIYFDWLLWICIFFYRQKDCKGRKNSQSTKHIGYTSDSSNYHHVCACFYCIGIIGADIGPGGRGQWFIIKVQSCQTIRDYSLVEGLVATLFNRSFEKSYKYVEKEK